MSRIEKTYRRLIVDKKEGKPFLSSPAMLILTVVYLIFVLSVPVTHPQKLIWLGAYPIIAAEMTGIGFGRLFVRSLWILPVVLLIGMINPIVDRNPAFEIGSIEVTAGWVSFVAIILRGLLSFQAILLLVATIGFGDIFRTIRFLGMPQVLCTQMMLTYRYIAVLLEEIIIMKRARAARGYGKQSYPLKMWGQFVGQLFIRSVQRAEAIHRAMLARGFYGTLPTAYRPHWDMSSIVRLGVAILVISGLRFIDFFKL